jgi:hypothetical protein
MRFGWLLLFAVFFPLASNLCRASARADFHRHRKEMVGHFYTASHSFLTTHSALVSGSGE